MADLSFLLNTFPVYFSGYLKLTLAALVIGGCCSLPIGVIAAKSRKYGQLLLDMVGVVQTIPSLALLAIMVAIFGGKIGFWPAFAALALYSMLPIIRNTAAGIMGVGVDIIEAAKASGMTPRQMLFRVQLPLALPVIVAGFRTSSIWVAGGATFATPVGADSLGYYIFMGLNTRQLEMTVFGCVLSALSALFLDRAVGIMEVRIRKRQYRSAVSVGVFLAGFCCVFMLLPELQALRSNEVEHAKIREPRMDTAPSNDAGVYVVGAKNFTEQYILADVIASHIKMHVGPVNMKTGLGSKVAFDALANSEIDVYVDYTGTIWSTVLGQRKARSPTHTRIQVASYLLEKYGISVVGPLGFENSYSFAIKKGTGRRVICRVHPRPHQGLK